MLIVGGQNTSINSLIITNPLDLPAAPLGDVIITPPLETGQHLVYTPYLNDGTLEANPQWRNAAFNITGGSGVIVDTDVNGFNWALSVDNTVMRNSGDQTLYGSMYISGDLTVNGNTNINTVGVDIGTSMIVLNGDLPSGTPPYTNGSFYVYRGNTGLPSTGLVWNEASQGWYIDYRTGVNINAPGFPVNGAGTLVGSYLLWNSGNDGPGSGLDADLLDGNQGTFYQNADNLVNGTLLPARLPAFNGDVTSTQGTTYLTIPAKPGLVAGTYGSATSVPVITVASNGLVTAAKSATIPTATTTTAGLLSTATQAETAAGVLTTKAVTPNSLTGALNNLQPKNANLNSISLQTITPDSLMYGTGTGTFSLTPLPAYGRTLISSINAQAARDTLGVPTPTDSGWVSIPLSNGFTNFPGDGNAIAANPMQCRKVDKTVFIRGIARRVAGPPNSGTIVGTLPVGFRPASAIVYHTMWISGTYFESQIWNSFINVDGTINSGFMYNVSATVPQTDGNVSFCLSFLVD